MENNTLNVSSISEGFVLDHIQAGKSMDIYHYLRLASWIAVSQSSKMQEATKWERKIL